MKAHIVYEDKSCIGGTLTNYYWNGFNMLSIKLSNVKSYATIKCKNPEQVVKIAEAFARGDRIIVIKEEA